MMKSVGEIASKMWPVAQYLAHFGKKLTLTFDLDPNLFLVDMDENIVTKLIL